LTLTFLFKVFVLFFSRYLRFLTFLKYFERFFNIYGLHCPVQASSLYPVLPTLYHNCVASAYAREL